MEQRFREVFKILSVGEATSPTILAVSGGIDSVVMAYLFQASEIPFSIVHCNFQLRDEESDIDEKFVVDLGEEMEAEVMVKRFETEKYAIDNGVSIQMAARDLRYEWFNELATKNDSKVAIAHHANDVAETMLYNLTKGTGLAGLHGIAEDDGIFIRPMLWAKKEEIEDFARDNGIDWRDDSSNESEKYMRNIIRKKVVPELERVNPAFISTNLRNAARIKDAERFVQHSINQLAIAEEKDGHIYIKKDALFRLPGSRSVLYQLINDYGFSYDQVISIEKSQERVGAIFITKNWILNIDRDYLIISKSEGNPIERLVHLEEHLIDLEEITLKAEVKNADGYSIKYDNQVAALDLEKLNFPLLVRNWQQGDSFSPLGMQGKKKVSDFLIDEKVPVNLKRKILVLISGNEVVWVVGHRISEHFKITPQTKEVYQATRVSV
ncbi:MAG: tRNA lysidine(34) synthetase TilS [Bacteroidetes bacterium]|nr:MAG: tRNA lysidine(34) synthetase TilS [Bacteroidota bacterium]